MIKKHKEAVAGYLFLAPNFLGFLVFMLFPIIASLILSFLDYSLLRSYSYSWVGLQNYQDLSKDIFFWQSLKNTTQYTILGVPFKIILALFLAVLLNQKIRGVGFFQAIYFLPVVCSMVAMALVWEWLFEPKGLINYILSYFGLGPFPWLTSSLWAMPSVVLVSIWKDTGYYMVIFYAALKDVPEELYEVAKIDGANAWKRFWYITFPYISPTTFFVIVTSIIMSFRIFELTTVLTRGGPGNATNTLVMLIYQNAFNFFRMGYASAIAYIFLGIILIFTAIQIALSKRWVHY